MLFGRKSRAVESAARMKMWRGDSRPSGRTSPPSGFTPDGQILSANPLFLAAVGYSADELVGKHHRIFCDEDYQASAAYVRFWKELASGTPQRGVFKRLRRDGSPIWLEATYFPVKNAEGAVVEVLKIAADVTRNHSELLLLNAINDSIRQSMAVIEFTRTARYSMPTKLPASLRLQPQVAQGPAPPHALLRRVLSGEPGFLGPVAARRILPRAFRTPHSRR